MCKVFLSLLVTVLSASLGFADIYLISDGEGKWIQVESLDKLPVGHVVLLARLKTDTDVPDPPDPDPSNLSKKVEVWARAVNEPTIAVTLGESYEQWARSMRVNNTQFQDAMDGAEAMEPFILRGSSKSDDWEDMLDKMRNSVKTEPQTAETLDEIAQGLKAAGGEAASELNFPKLIECILCFIEAWTSQVETAAIETKKGGIINLPTPAPMQLKGLQEAQELFNKYNSDTSKSVVVNKKSTTFKKTKVN